MRCRGQWANHRPLMNVLISFCPPKSQEIKQRNVTPVGQLRWAGPNISLFHKRMQAAEPRVNETHHPHTENSQFPNQFTAEFYKTGFILIASSPLCCGTSEPQQRRETRALQCWLVNIFISWTSYVCLQQFEVLSEGCKTKTTSTFGGEGHLHAKLMSYSLRLPLTPTSRPMAWGGGTFICFHNVLHINHRNKGEMSKESVIKKKKSYKENRQKDELSFFGLHDTFSIFPCIMKQELLSSRILCC